MKILNSTLDTTKGLVKYIQDYTDRYPKRIFWFYLIVITIFGITQAVFRFSLSLNTDEPFTANLVSLSTTEMIRAFQYESTSPLYYILLHFWVMIFGESEIALRSLSAIFFGGTILVSGSTSRRLGGVLAGIVAAFLISISNIVGHEFAAAARQYALLGLICSIALYYETKKLGSNKPLDCKRSSRLPIIIDNGRLVMIHTIGLLTHPIYFFYIVAIILASIFISSKHTLIAIISSAFSIILYLLIWGSFLKIFIQYPATSWMETPGLLNLIFSYLNLWGFIAAGEILTLIFLMILFQRQAVIDVMKSSVGKYLFSILILSSLLPFIFSFIKPVFHAIRTPVIFLPVASIFIAVLITQFKPRMIIYILMIVLAMVSACSVIFQYKAPDPQPARTSVKYIIDNGHCGDYIISVGLAYSEVEYYLRRNDSVNCFIHRPYPLEVQVHPGWLDEEGILENRERLEMEARSLALDMKSESNVRSWILYPTERYAAIGSILHAELDKALRLDKVIGMGGSFFDLIYIYSSPGNIENKILQHSYL